MSRFRQWSIYAVAAMGCLAGTAYAQNVTIDAEPLSPPPPPPPVGIAPATETVVTRQALPTNADIVLTGQVLGVYKFRQPRSDAVYDRCVAEMRVTQVERGPGIRPGQLIYVRYWVPEPAGNSAAAGYWPAHGESVRVFLNRDPDGGLEAVTPNGFIMVTTTVIPVPDALVDSNAEKIAPNTVTGVVTLIDAPVANVEVVLLVQGGVAKTTVTDANGRFLFKDVPPGLYTVTASGVVKNRIRDGARIPVSMQANAETGVAVRIPLEP